MYLDRNRILLHALSLESHRLDVCFLARLVLAVLLGVREAEALLDLLQLVRRDILEDLLCEVCVATRGSASIDRQASEKARLTAQLDQHPPLLAPLFRPARHRALRTPFLLRLSTEGRKRDGAETRHEEVVDRLALVGLLRRLGGAGGSCGSESGRAGEKLGDGDGVRGEREVVEEVDEVR